MWSFVVFHPETNVVRRFTTLRDSLLELKALMSQTSLCAVFHQDGTSPIETIRYLGSYNTMHDIFMHTDIHDRITYTGEGMTPYQLAIVMEQNPNLFRQDIQVESEKPDVKDDVIPDVDQEKAISEDHESEIGSSSEEEEEEENEHNSESEEDSMPTSKPTKTISLPKHVQIEELFTEIDDIEDDSIPHPKKDERSWSEIETTKSHHRNRRIFPKRRR